MAQQTKNNNQNITYLGILLIMIGLAGSYFYVVPRLKDARQKLAIAQAKADGLADDIKNLEDAKKQLESAKTALQAKGVNFSKFRYVYPPTEDVPPLYIQMEALMGGTPGVTGATYQISPPVSEGTGNVRVPIAVTANGAYEPLKSFVRSLQMNIRPLSISSLNFSQAVVKDKDGKVIGASSTDYTLSLTGFARASDVSSAYSQLNPAATSAPSASSSSSTP